ncbi:amino acid aminotransferase [Alysiella filiformis]|uniref:Aminotransferase n=1 Tax=Alysiella filiformis DSM 16848 TaxID=1120981 RepID=A0A286E5C0_9NEIS|nr:amino acid aminotransferase [Alysiella filiformis]QMT30408.1 aspartate/tyrosine/aromatic aminotransferase [Alysiella filiformis]UBQ56610.1 aspartate/tyrosine/aromatic aminotransferase [Alysiella filiformis DSM 16848]SOD66061.1 aromatic-amino-acid transaminase [Alysiella filiformis DSM 16848]
MYQHVTPYAGDPILSLVETFKQDPRPNKINLSIGIYFDNEGKMPFPNSVFQAAQRIENQVQPYLPMEGHAGFRAAVAKLLFGAESLVLQENRVAAVQTLGGSGALKLGADFIHRWFPQSHVFVSDPTWDNHRGIFEGAGFEVGSYPYYDPATIGVKFDAMCDFFRSLPEHSVVLLHPCCHNPTGVDLLPEQWDTILNIVAERQLIPFMDIAYQGFGDTFDSDAYAIRQAAKLNLPLFVSCSFSKNMSLYGQRVGALMVLAPNAAQADLVLGQLKFIVRRIYSSPPAQGVLAAQGVLGDTNLAAQWQNEVYEMRDRIRAMRLKLYEVLREKLPEKDFSYFVKQRGMFSYTGLSVAQVQRLRDEFAIYVLDSGRLCVAGLNEGNVETVAKALAQVFAE